MVSRCDVLPVFIQNLERDKTCSLQHNAGNFDPPIFLSASSKQELSCWIANGSDSYNVVGYREAVTGWSCVIGRSWMQGLWAKEESLKHINYQEIPAVFLSLKSFVRLVTNKQVKILMDNTTALSDINHIWTSKKEARNELVKTIWLWCK